MHRCVCTTRALELFVKDLAGLQLQSAAKPGFRRWNGVASTRGFGSARRVREQEIGSVARMEVKDGVGSEVDSVGRSLATERDARRFVDGEKEVVVEDPSGKRDQAPADSASHAEVAGSSGPLEEKTQRNETKPIPQETGESMALAGRAESRLQRKHRRLAAGTYRPRANGLAGEVEDPQVEAVDSRIGVLDMIEKLEGPGIAKRKEQKQYDADSRKDNSEGAARTKQKEVKLRSPPPKKEQWQIQKAALNSKFGEAGWSPRKRLSPDTLDGIRALHASDPATYSTETLAEQFAVSPENIRRILKSKWKPAEAEADRRRERWERRGVRKWEEMAKEGKRPPKRWREMGVGSVKGEPEEKPAWKRGGRRREASENAEWIEEKEGGFEGRII